MLKCSKEAFAACPTRRLCGSQEEATFTEGSDCDKFNRQIGSHTMTNADRIRAMSDEELANLLASKMANIKELEMAEKGIRVTATQISLLASRLHDIWLQWLRQPAENPVEWSKSGPCPVTPEQFDAIYNDEEETT